MTLRLHPIRMKREFLHDEEIMCKIKSKVKKSGLNVKVAWKNNQKLKDK